MKYKTEEERRLAVKEQKENKKLVDYGFNRGKHKNEEGRMVV